MKKIHRILHVVPNMDSGGIENLIMNIYRNIDRTKIQFDFIVHYNRKCFFDDEIESLGGKIYRFPVLEDKNIFKYINSLKKFFKEHKEYKVIHGHMASLAYIYLGIAKKNGIPIRIAHSHGTSHLKSLKGYVKYIMFKFAKYNANYYYACSTEAGEYLFGKKYNFEFIPNAIELDRFKYNLLTRNKIRKELKIENNIVIGHVGRFNLQKNHEFLIDIFSKIVKQVPNAVLILVGKGELENTIKDKVLTMGIHDNVKFLGVRKDIANIYQGFDLFLMPSIFEGLPLTGIEAQESGLPCIFSDSITKEVKISDYAFFYSLKKSAEEWSNFVLSKINLKRQNAKINDELFDIKKMSKKMEKKYLNFYNKDGE